MANKNRDKGSRNQRKSRDFMIANPWKYGLLDISRIEIVRGGLGSLDFFSVDFGLITKKLPQIDVAQIDPEGDPSKVVIVNKKIEYDRAGFDIISIPDPSNDFPEHVYLVQVKTNRMPKPDYLQTLIQIKFPSFVKKELHVWMDGHSVPNIFEL